MPQTNEQIKKSIFAEVKLIWAVVGIVVGIAFWAWNNQSVQDINIAKLQTSITAIDTRLNVIQNGDLKDLKADMLENRAEINKLAIEIAQLEILINERIPARK